MSNIPSGAASKPASWRTAADAARACHELGLSAVALVPRSKQPKIKSYPALGLVMPAPEQAQHLDAPGEVALVGGHGVFAVDVDAGEGAATFVIKRHLGEPLCVVRGNRGCKMLYAMERPDVPAELGEAAREWLAAGAELTAAERSIGDVERKAELVDAARRRHTEAGAEFNALKERFIEGRRLIRNAVASSPDGEVRLEILSFGHVIVVPPSVHPTSGRRYRFDGEPLDDYAIAMARTATREDVNALLREIRGAAHEEEISRDDARAIDSDDMPLLIERTRAALSHLLPDVMRSNAACDDGIGSLDCDDYDCWLRAGMAIKLDLGEEGFDLWDEWSARGTKYAPHDPHNSCEAKWATFDGRLDGSGRRQVRLGTVFRWATARGWDGRALSESLTTEQPEEVTCADDDCTEIVIRVGGPEIHDPVDEIGAAIERVMPETVFRQSGSGHLVRIRRLEQLEIAPGQHITRPAGVHVVTRAEARWTMLELSRTRRVEFVRYDARSKRDVTTAPREDDFRGLETIGDRMPFRVLGGVSTVPTLSRSTPGYDPESGFYLAFRDGEFPATPAAPSRDDALAALRVVKRPLRAFPFKGRASQSAVLSAMLSGIVRYLLPTCPLHAFTSPTPGTGKGLLTQCVAMIVTGAMPSMVEFTGDDAEMEKRLGALLLSGDGLIVLDNVTEPLGGKYLNLVLTSQFAKTRVLGKSEEPTVDTRRLILANGNNLRIAGDTTRRVIVGRLDAGVELPHLLRFDFDALEETTRARPEIVTAALTLLRGHALAGRPVPQGHAPLGGFKHWDQLVRCALIWAGEADPLETQLDAQDGDPDRMERADILRTLHEWSCIFGQFRLKELAEDTGQDAHTARQAIAGQLRGGMWDTRLAGAKLAEIEDRPTAGLVLRCERDRKNGNVWRVESSRTDV